MASNIVNEQRQALINGLEVKYATKFNNKMRRKLSEASDNDFGCHALGMEIYACMRVCTHDLSSIFCFFRCYNLLSTVAVVVEIGFKQRLLSLL